MGAVHVAGPEPGSQPERRVVGDAQTLGLVFELRNREDRPEDLLARDAPAIVDAVEDRRADIVATGLLAYPLTPGDDARALPTTDVDVAKDLVELAGVDDRPESGRRIERLAGRQSTTHLGDPLDQLFADAAVDDES